MSETSIADLQAQLDALKEELRQSIQSDSLPATVPNQSSSDVSPPASSIQTVKHAPDPLEELDRRIATEPPHIGMDLILVRAQLVMQREASLDRAHVRSLEKRNFYAKVGMSAGALGAGVALAFGGFGLPAFVCLGAGLYAIAPNFIDRVTDRIYGKGKQ